jgi:hypothetical protein
MKRLLHFTAIAVLAATPCLFADDAPAPRRPDVRQGDAPAPREERAAPARADGGGERAGDRGGDRGRERVGDRGGDRAADRGGARDERGLGRGPMTAASYIETMDAAVTLTDDQKKGITAIFEVRDKAIKDFETDNADKIKAASKAMEDAILSRDQEAIGKARQEYREIFGTMHEVMRKANEDLENLLTADQKTKLVEARVTRDIQAYVAPAKLTDEQMKKLVALAIVPSENRRDSLENKIAAAVEEMLTPEQKVGIARRQAISQVQRRLAGARLTREQSAQIETAYDELAKEAGLSKEDLATKLTEKVNGILTDEQKEAIKNSQPGRRDGGEPRAPRPGGDEPRRTGGGDEPKPSR